MASVKKKKKSNFADQVINGDYQSVFSGGNTGIGSNKSVGITSNKRSLLGDDSPFLSTKKKSSFADQVIGGTFEPFVDTTPKITNNKDYSSLNKNELKKEKEKLQKEIEKQSKKLNKTPWWDKEDNVVENIGNVLYKSFLEKEPIVHDEEYKKYKALTEQMNELKKAQEDNYVKNQKYDKGLLGFIEKSNDTTVGNVMTGIKGIESTTKKILGQEDDIDYDLTLEEKFSSKAREESSGAMGVYLDVIGSIARMTPQLMIGNSKGAIVTGFANYGGGAYNEAKRDGYSEEQATKYGLTVGVMEMATERILGGFGNLYGMSKMGKVTGKVIDKVIPKLIKNKAVREIINQSIAEGSEEFLQEYLGNVAKDVILDEKGFFKSVGENVTDTDVLADALYSAFVGGLTGGLVATKPSIDKAKYEKATGRNAETGLTVNEQSVIDSVSSEKKAELQKKKAVDTEVNKIIKEQEKTFGTLTNAEKKGIRQDVQSRLDNGEIDYSTAKLSSKEIKSIESQVKAELQKGYIGTDVIENTLGKDVDLSKDDYLQKSYYEKSLKSKQFTYKASENDSEFRKELAKTSDVLNDTTRSHELFDTVAKISEDTGTKYGFVNNEKLKSLGHNVEGKTINGLVRVNEDGTSKVLINVDSDKALNTIIGHETTHLLEGTNEYQALQDIVKEYAKNKGDYDSRYNQISSLYQGTNANVDNEVTSDLVGDYLFTDEEFVKNLSAKEPTVFQKVYDYIKHVYNLVTAGSKEQRELEKVKYRFEQVYNEMSKTTNQQSKTNLTTEAGNDRAKELSGTKYSLSDNQGRTLSKEQQEYFKDSKVRDEEGNLKVMYHGTEAMAGLPEDAWFTVFDTKRAGSNGSFFGTGFYFTDSKVHAQDYAHSKGKVYETYLNIKNPYIPYQNLEDSISRTFKEDLIIRLNINKEASSLTGKEITEILKENGYDGVINGDTVVAFYPEQIKNVDNTTPTNNLDIRYSLSVSEANTTKDNEDRKLTKGQKEYFKDSKVVDENGNLITVYHTMTNKGIQFNEFNPVGTDYYKFGNQVVNYYTDSKNMSGSYAQQDYEMADTSKLNNLSEAYDYVEKIKNTPNTIFSNDVMKTLNLEENNGKYVLKFNGNTMVTYDSETDVLKKIKVDLDNRYGKSNKYQYEGYINITNPYEVDAEGRSWSAVSKDVDENIVEEVLSLTADQKEGLIKLQKDAFEGYQEHLNENRDFEYLQSALKKLPEMEQYNIMMDLPLDEPNTEITYYNWVSSVKVETRQEFAKRYREGMDNYYNYKTPDTYFYNQLNSVYNQKYIEPSELYELASREFKDSYGEDLTRSYYEGRYQKKQSTNDIVKQVIDMNKNGSKYDGVIFKNVYDYGGHSGENELTPNDVYVTFNSNQFKAVDNTNPTNDPDIRYSLSKSIPLEERVNGDILLDAQDLIDEVKSVGANVDENGYVTVYHVTTPENAKSIKTSGKMKANEPAVYFSTSKNAQQGEGRGGTTLEFKIPAEKLLLDDLFSDNADVKIPLKNKNEILDVSNYLVNNDTQYSLSNEGLKNIADEFGKGKNYWEANLYDKDLNGAILFLKRNDSVKEKFKELNNIKVEPVYKNIELRSIGSEDANIQKFIKDNNLTVIDLVNNQELLDKFYELEHEAIKNQYNVDDNEANEIFSQWKDYFERQKGLNDVIWPLFRFEKDFKNIIEGNTKEVDNIETVKLERQLVDDNPEFEKYVTKYAEKLFNEKVEYDVDDVMEEAKFNHGTTDDFEVGAYMTTDGSLLNFNYGGYRDDHRTISVYDLNMKEFMDYGAIRMQPETPGFEMQVEPTSEQYSKLYDYIDYIKSTRKSDDKISIDIDKGNFYDSALYNMNTPTSKVINDVKTYWKTGSFPKKSEFADYFYSLSNQNENIAPVGNYNVYGKDVRLQQQVQEAIVPLQEQIKVLSDQLTTLTENIAPVSQDVVERESMNNFNSLTDEDAPTNLSDDEIRELNRLNSLPFDLEGEERSRVDELTSKQDEYGSFTFDNETPEVKNKSVIIKDLKGFGMSQQEARNLYNKIANDSTTTPEDIFNELKNYRDIYEESDYYKQIRDDIKGTRLNISNIKDQITDYGNSYRMSLMGKRLILGNSGQPIDVFYQELSNNYPDVFSPEITAEVDQLNAIADFLYRDDKMLVDRLSDGEITELANKIYNEIDTTERLNNTRETLYSNSNFKNLVSLLEAEEITPETYEDFLKSLPKELSTKYEPYLEFARELNASSTDKTRQKDRIRSLLDEKSIKVQETTNEPTISSNNPFNELLDKFLKRNKTKNNVAPKVEKSKVRNLVDTTKELFVNRNTEIDNLAKESGNLNIKYAGDMLNSVAGEVEGDIYTAQTDNYGHEIGKSVSGLFQEAKNKGLYDAFNDYLEQYSNIDRHSRGKGSQTPLAISQTLVQEYEKSYPEFKKMAQDVWKYSSNIRDNMVESGLITQEFSDTLAEMYPHYVPFMENREMTNVYQDIGKVKPKGVIKYAKGGAKNLLPVEEALTKYTYASKKAIRQNQLYQQIVKTLNDKVEIGADVRSDPTELDTSLYRDEKGNYLTAYVNGKQESVRISDDLYRGLKNDMESRVKDLEQRLSLITKPLQQASKIRRNLLTTWNPTFIITNPVKDIQDAVFNSKYTKDMLKNYPTSFVELSKAKSETAKQFLALYGSGNTQGDYSTDSGLNKGIAKKNTKFLKGISKLNNIVELAPRYAEFKASLENGATVQEAMYNAREITTNFNRGGTITKALNRNGATFLNASVQGFDKFIRNFSGENGAKGVASALLKAGLFGVLPGVFNELVFGGNDDDKDEDYEALPDYIKDNYYLVKMENGEFIRIPKGRMLSAFGSASRRTIEYLNGEEDAFEGFLKNAYTQVGFDDPAESNIFTPIKQAIDNKAWYGGDLVPSRLQKLAPKEQYDASTDKFSIWLGNKLNISPYKINYVLDQYTGGIGDMVLPLITEEAQSDSDSIPEMMLVPIRDKFTANSTSDNKYASDIYTLSDKMDKMTSDIKETDEYKIQENYLYDITSQMAELYKERRGVQADTSLSKSEKYNKVQSIQKQINSLAKEGLDNYKNVQRTDNYAIVGGKEFNKYTTDDGKERWGKPREDELNDLNSMGMTLYEKSSYFKAKTDISSIKDEYKDSEDYVGQKRDIIDVIKNTYLNDEQKSYLYDRYYGNTETLGIINAIGIDFDSFLDYEAQQFTADKDENGKTISGSKKQKVFDYINSMDIDFEQKLILAKLQYNSYDEYNYDIIDYLNNNDDISYEDEVSILKKLGFTVDDEGNIYW